MLPGMPAPRKEQINELERLGESEVRYLLSSMRTGNFERHVAEEWLRQKELERAADSSARRDAREEETLSIAKRAADAASEANRIATESLAIAHSSSRSAAEQARWARWAVIIAVMAAIIATKDEILKFIFGLLYSK